MYMYIYIYAGPTFGETARVRVGLVGYYMSSVLIQAIGHSVVTKVKLKVTDGGMGFLKVKGSCSNR